MPTLEMTCHALDGGMCLTLAWSTPLKHGAQVLCSHPCPLKSHNAPQPHTPASALLLLLSLQAQATADAAAAAAAKAAAEADAAAKDEAQAAADAAAKAKAEADVSGEMRACLHYNCCCCSHCLTAVWVPTSCLPQ